MDLITSVYVLSLDRQEDEFYGDIIILSKDAIVANKITDHNGDSIILNSQTEARIN